MALQTIPGGGMTIPPGLAHAGGNPAFVGLLMDASAEKVAVIFQVPKTGTLDKFEFQLGTVTQAPANGLRCSLQDVSLVNGDPDGTDDQFRVVTTGLTTDTWVAPGLITSDGTDTGTKRSVTRGDLLACVIAFESFSASDSLNISAIDYDTAVWPNKFPYSDQFTASWAKVNGDQVCLALKYNDGTYAHLAPTIIPASAFNIATYNSGSTPDERGLIFQLPVLCKVGGAWLSGDLDGDADLVLYDSDGSTVLETVPLDTNVRQAGTAGPLFAQFDTDRQLSANTTYRLVLKPTSVTSLTLVDFDVSAAAILDSVPGGQNWHYTERTDAGAWTQTTTKRPWMGLCVTALDDGAGGAGGGGIRLAGHGGLAA